MQLGENSDSCIDRYARREAVQDIRGPVQVAVSADALSQHHTQVCEYTAHVRHALCVCHNPHVVQFWYLLSKPLELVTPVVQEVYSSMSQKLADWLLTDGQHSPEDVAQRQQMSTELHWLPEASRMHHIQIAAAALGEILA